MLHNGGQLFRLSRVRSLQIIVSYLLGKEITTRSMLEACDDIQEQFTHVIGGLKASLPFADVALYDVRQKLQLR